MKYISIIITIDNEFHGIDGATFYYSDGPIEFTHKLSIEEGWKELHRAEQILGTTATTEINQYDANIVNYTIHGFIDR